MIKNKLNILFYLDKKKVIRLGKCQLRFRITYLGTKKQHATGKFVNPSDWNRKQKLVKPPEREGFFKLAKVYG